MMEEINEIVYRLDFLSQFGSWFIPIASFVGILGIVAYFYMCARDRELEKRYSSFTGATK